jgi:hypothetical protein
MQYEHYSRKKYINVLNPRSLTVIRSLPALYSIPVGDPFSMETSLPVFTLLPADQEVEPITIATFSFESTYIL